MEMEITPVLYAYAGMLAGDILDDILLSRRFMRKLDVSWVFVYVV